MSRVSFSPRARWFAVAALYVGITLAYAWPLLPAIGSALPNDLGDPGLNTWILWWNAHAVPLTTRWWDAPIFYPAKGALALSETLLNLFPLSTPMQWAGASAVLMYNVLFLLSFPAAALAAHALARRLTGRHDAALIAGLAFGFAPYRAAQMAHLQTLWSCWMPLGLLALHRFLEGRRRRDLALFGLCWLMNGLATGYYLVFFSVLAGLWTLWFARTVRDWTAIGVTAVLASLPLTPLLVGYQHYQSAFGVSRSLQEIELFSADLSAIWATSPWVWPARWTLAAAPEGELYPGATILVLVLDRRRRRVVASAARPAVPGAALAACRGGPARRADLSRVADGRLVLPGGGIERFHEPPASGDAADAGCRRGGRAVECARRCGVAAAVAAVLLRDGRRRDVHLRARPRRTALRYGRLVSGPYSWLMHLPGGHALRVPARFAMLFALCLAEAAAVAFARLTPRGARPALAAPLCLAVALEGFVPHLRVAPVSASADLGGLDRGSIMLELPITDDYLSDTTAMLHATQVGRRLVNGFSGYVPTHYDLLKRGLASLDDSVIRALQQSSALLVYVHEGTDEGDRDRDFIANLPDAEHVLTTPSGSLYKLPARPPDRRPAARLPILAVHTNSSTGDIGNMTDGDLTTRWETHRPQTIGDEVTIEFRGEVTPSRLELDLGAFRNDYPRKLRVSLIDGQGRASVVWEGRTTGLAVLATLADLKRMPLVFDLARAGSGRSLVLTLLDGHHGYSWSIAELRVFGR